MEELDIKELLYEFWKKKFLIVVIVVMGIASGMFYSQFLVKPMYKSTTTLVLSKPTSNESSSTGITTNDITINQKLVSTYSEIMKSRSVASSVREKLSLSMSESDIEKSITVQSKKDTELLEISVSNADPKTASTIANTLAEVFTEKVKEVYKIENVSVIDKAIPDEMPYNVNLKKTIALFAIGALFIACAIIFATVYFNNTFKNPDEIEKTLGLPVLAVIPRMSEKE